MKTDEQHTEVMESSRRPMNPRDQGLLCALGGALAAALFLGWPIYRIHQGAQSVTLFTKLGYGGVLFFYAGIAVAVLGKIPIPDQNMKLSAISWREWLVILVGMALIILTMYAVDSHLESLGFSRRR